MSAIATVCPRCGWGWDESMDMCDLFNHNEVHRWIDAGLTGATSWTVRTHGTDEEKRDRVMAWALEQVAFIVKSMARAAA